MKAARQTVAAMEGLADSTRLQLMARLRRRPEQSIASLTRGTTLSRQAVSKHLRRLERGGLVRCSRRGREQLWSVNEHWDEALERLRSWVEGADRA